jgi:hypothetical protein
MMNVQTKKPQAAETVEDVLNELDKRRETNLRIWNVLGKTDPAHTKQFSRAGGFRGTAIKPIWITQRLTEQFGPCGKGWGFEKPEFQVVPTQTDTLVYCTVTAWYLDGEPGQHVVYGVGGDKVVAQRQSGPFCDDEAFKKAFTDALGNAFKFVGVGADVHMGLFEDSKYLAEVAAEFHPKADPDKKREKAKLDGPYDTLPKLEKAAREFARTLRGMGTLADFESWKQDEEVIAFVDQCKRDLPGWWFPNHQDCPPDFTPLAVEVANTKRGLAEIEEMETR